MAGQGLEPRGINFVIGIHYADYFSMRIRMVKREIQRASLEALALVQMIEAEPGTRTLAPRFDRTPRRFLLRIVIDNQHFEVFIIEPRHAFERQDHHRGRLVAARQMNRHERRVAGRICKGHEFAGPLAAPQSLDELETVDEQHGHRRDHRGNDHHERAHVYGLQIKIKGHADEPDRERCRSLDQGAKK